MTVEIPSLSAPSEAVPFQRHLNQQLSAKKLQPIRLIPEQEWQKAQDAAEGGGTAAPSTMGMREMD